MKFSRISLVGLIFAAVLLMPVVFHISHAREESEETRRRKDQHSIGGMEAAEKRNQPLRERRAVKGNSTEDILERLQDLEIK